jgi:hypothetical protein
MFIDLQSAWAANEFRDEAVRAKSVNAPLFAAPDKTRRPDESQADGFGD